ncbi:MAG TPA: SGNH/GDSL hydrolase family protein [Candidatus Hydrogenedentes bacterium]|nr:SGNH/GDSL hydrolase family protein [Candidatus Hydrogenedentota bacterium]
MLGPIGLPVVLWAADSVVGEALGWRPYGMVEFVVVGGMLGLAGLMVAGCYVGTVYAVLSRWNKELWLLLGALVVAWALLEAGADRVDRMLRPEKQFHTRGPNMRWVFTPVAEYLPGIEGVSHYTTDAQGIRQASVPEKEDFRVLCVGGSTTECVYLDDQETWPSQLMKLLNGGKKPHVRVGNVGISGYDTRDHIRFLKTSPLLKGIDCVILQIGINDLWRYLANEEVLTRYDRFSEAGFEGELVPRVRETKEAWRPVWTRSRVIQLVHTLRLPRPKPETVEGAGGTEYKIRQEKRAAAHITEQIPDLTRGLNEYKERIKKIVTICRERRFAVLFTTQPVLWRADLSLPLTARCWFGWLEDGEYLSIAALRECMDRYNEVTLSVCKELNVPCVDLSVMNGREEYFYDDCHFTERGAQEAGRLLAPMVMRIMEAHQHGLNGS